MSFLRKILVVCGTGGVGKTTVSAAIAARAAILGRRVVVITVDPAKRLATSLGVDRIGDEPVDLTERLREIEPETRGRLAAVMPDTARTFDSLIDELCARSGTRSEGEPGAALAERIKKNPIFQMVSREFSGANEYMAIERLYELSRDADFDLVVLDTPPSRNSLAFLDAPELLGRFFDEKLVRWFVLPANQLVAAGMKKAFGLLESLTGSGFMGHLFEFGAAMFEVRVEFAANLRRILALLADRGTGFCLVASPSQDPAEASRFLESVLTRGFQYDGLIFNRALSGIPRWSDGSQAAELLGKLQDIEEESLRAAGSSSPGRGLGQVQGHALAHAPVKIHAKIPELLRDVHSLEDLVHVARFLGTLGGVDELLGV